MLATYTVHDLIRQTGDLPLWWLIVLIPAAAFIRGFASVAADDLHAYLKRRRNLASRRSHA